MLDYFQAAVPIVALAINVVVQVAVSRRQQRGGFVRGILIGFGAGLFSLFALTVLDYYYQAPPWQETTAIILVDMGTYVALAFCYLAFANLSKTSLRIRLFRELQQAKSGLTVHQIQSLYNDRRIFELRLGRLLNSKQVTNRDGRYFLGGRSLWFIARTVHITKVVMIGQDSQFTEARAKAGK